MKTILRILSNGFGLIADGYTRPRGYVWPVEGGFVRDHDQLTGDVRRIGADIRKTINNRDKQANKTPSYAP